MKNDPTLSTQEGTMSKTFSVRVGFPVNTVFSSNGISKMEYRNIKISAENAQDARERIMSGYADLNAVIMFVKEIV